MGSTKHQYKLCVFKLNSPFFWPCNPILAVCLSLVIFGFVSFTNAQTNFDLDEINGDTRKLGDEENDKIGDKETVALLDFNGNQLNDLLWSTRRCLFWKYDD